MSLSYSIYFVKQLENYYLNVILFIQMTETTPLIKKNLFLIL